MSRITVPASPTSETHEEPTIAIDAQPSSLRITLSRQVAGQLNGSLARRLNRATKDDAQPRTVLVAMTEIDGDDLAALVAALAPPASAPVPLPAPPVHPDNDERHKQVLAECERLIARNAALEHQHSQDSVFRHNVRHALAQVLATCPEPGEA